MSLLRRESLISSKKHLVWLNTKKSKPYAKWRKSKLFR